MLGFTSLAVALESKLDTIITRLTDILAGLQHVQVDEVHSYVDVRVMDITGELPIPSSELGLLVEVIAASEPTHVIVDSGTIDVGGEVNAIIAGTLDVQVVNESPITVDARMQSRNYNSPFEFGYVPGSKMAGIQEAWNSGASRALGSQILPLSYIGGIQYPADEDGAIFLTTNASRPSDTYQGINTNAIT